MSTHANEFRLGTWFGVITPNAEVRACLEDKLTEARTWLVHGEKRLAAWRKEMQARKDMDAIESAPHCLHPMQAGG